MDQQIRTAYESTRKIADKPFRSACYAPYTSLYFHTNGDVVACCKSANYVLGNVAKERLHDIWRGKRANAMRKSLRDYRFGMGCEFCEWQVRGGQYDQVYATTFDHLPVASEDPEWPAMMEFTISNTCNLACIMCFGELSSTIRATREKRPPLPKVYDERFFQDLRQFLPHLKVAKFFGGEPFLAQENYRVWDMMLEDGITIPCHVTTNGTQWNARVERILESLPVWVSISIDGATKETVESIRVNAKFETLMANVRKFRDYARRKQTYMSLTYCLMRQNWHEFGDYLRMGEEMDLEVFINTVISPPECSLYTLPPDELRAIIDKMEAMDAREQYSGLRMNGRVWTSALGALRHNANERQMAGVEDIRKANAKHHAVAHPSQLAKARKLEAAGDLTAALAEVRLTRADDPDAFDAALAEAAYCRQLERLDECERAVERALGMWKKSPRPWLERAWLRYRQGRFEEGLADAEMARSHVDAHDEEVLCWVYHVLAILQAQLGQKEAAIAALAAVPERAPNHYEVLTMQAWLLRDVGRLAESEAAIERARAAKPSEPKAWIERAWLRHHQNRPQEGLADVEAAQQRCAPGSPYAAELHHVSAVLCERMGRVQDALRHVEELLVLRPGRPEVLIGRARLRESTGDLANALVDAQAVLSAFPHHAEAAELAAHLQRSIGK